MNDPRVEVAAYLAQFQTEAGLLVEQRWSHVQRIARALLERGRIEGAELRRIYYRK